MCSACFAKYNICLLDELTILGVTTAANMYRILSFFPRDTEEGAASLAQPVKASEPDNVNSVSRFFTAERENKLAQVVL